MNEFETAGCFPATACILSKKNLEERHTAILKGEMEAQFFTVKCVAKLPSSCIEPLFSFQFVAYFNLGKTYYLRLLVQVNKRTGKGEAMRHETCILEYNRGLTPCLIRKELQHSRSSLCCLQFWFAHKTHYTHIDVTIYSKVISMFLLYVKELPIVTCGHRCRSMNVKKRGLKQSQAAGNERILPLFPPSEGEQIV